MRRPSQPSLTINQFARTAIDTCECVHCVSWVIPIYNQSRQSAVCNLHFNPTPDHHATSDIISSITSAVTQHLCSTSISSHRRSESWGSHCLFSNCPLPIPQTHAVEGAVEGRHRTAPHRAPRDFSSVLSRYSHNTRQSSIVLTITFNKSVNLSQRPSIGQGLCIHAGRRA